MANFAVGLIASPIDDSYLSAIVLYSMPTKTRYVSGEYFDPAGMVVQAIYNTGVRKNVEQGDYTWEPKRALTDSDTTVIVSYTEGAYTRSVDIAITMVATLTGIEIAEMPKKTVYYFNEKPNYEGMVVNAKYSNGVTEPITNWVAPTTPLTQLGSVGLTVSYSEGGERFTADVPVTVQPKVIEKIPSQSNTLTYNSDLQQPTWADYNLDELSIGGALNGVNAGSYEVEFTPKYGYCWDDTTTTARTVSWLINRAKIETIPSQKEVPTYNSSVIIPEWNDYNPTELAISGDTSATDAGSYTAIFTPTDNYCWFDDSIEGKDIEWSIAKATLEVPSQQGILTYNGELLKPTWSNDSIKFCDVEGIQESIDAGSFTLTLTPKSNFTWADGTETPQQVTWTIGRAILQVPQQSGALTYNTKEQKPTLSNNSADYCIVSGTTSATNAGTYTLTLTPTSNYEWSDNSTESKDITWVIGQATPYFKLFVDGVPLDMDNPSVTLTADRSEVKITWETDSDSSVGLSAPSDDILSAGISQEYIQLRGLSNGQRTIHINLKETNNYMGTSVTIEVNVEMAQGRLPKGYTEVAWIQNTDDTSCTILPAVGYVHNIEFDVEILNPETSGQTFIGYRYNRTVSPTAQQYDQFAWMSSSRVLRWYYQKTTSLYASADIAERSNRLYVKTFADQTNSKGGNNSWEVNGDLHAWSGSYYFSGSNHYPAIFGWVSYSYTSSSVGQTTSLVQTNLLYKLYSLKMANQNYEDYIADYVPCISAEQVIGLYDIIQDKFVKVNGNVIAGPVVK